MKSLSVRLGVIAAAIFFILLFSMSTFAGNLDKPYSSTRKEWLEISIFKVIKDRTDPWRERIGFLVWVREEENTVFITLTSANGQEPLTKETENKYLNIVKGDVEEFIRNYSWSKSLKVFVQFR
jgi:hypothetical protein